MKAKIREHRGTLECGADTFPCALGPAGLVTDKKEGDGGTPIAEMALLKVYYRADRIAPPTTTLPVQAIASDDGWCDDPALGEYNQPVKLPFEGGHEKMWLEDHVYDICVVLDWNLNPPVAGNGSAIFFHLAREGYTPTEGCIAVSEPDMRRILEQHVNGETLETILVS